MSSLRKENERLYRIWSSMKRRCNNPHSDKYTYYGGRGISVCEEWNSFEEFYRWSVENGYNDTLSIDRIDPDGNYEPSNCRWATLKEQMNNKRNNQMFNYEGQILPITKVEEITGIGRYTLRQRRKYGWDDYRATHTPIQPHKPYKNTKNIMEIGNGK